MPKHRTLIILDDGRVTAERRAGPSASWPFPGFIALLYVGLYFSKRFVLEFFRVEPKWWGPLSWAQLASIIDDASRNSAGSCTNPLSRSTSGEEISTVP